MFIHLMIRSSRELIADLKKAMHNDQNMWRLKLRLIRIRLIRVTY
jgi:hypothetical protein